MPSYPVPPQNLSVVRPTMTALSGHRVGQRRNFTGLSGVARTSLVTLAVMALGTSGCLITDKAEFSQPAPVPPFLTDLDPPATEILNIPTKPGGGDRDYVDDKPLAFKVRSEDLQRYLFTAVLVDFPGSNPKPACFFPPDLGSLDTARPRDCKLNILPSVTPGCHSITALISHDSSIQIGVIKNPSDVGTATWWAQIGTDPMYDPCEPHPSPGDAGADARDGGGL